MKQFTRRVRRNGRTLFDSRIYIAAGGAILSVVLHELFHGIVHWGNISYIRFLPNSHAIVEIVAKTPIGYNPLYEEAIAYTITVMTLFVTIIYVGSLNDKKDTRTVTQAIFPRDARMQALTPDEMYNLAVQAKVF